MQEKNTLDCSQALYLAHAKEIVSEASAKHAGVPIGGEVCERKRARTNREAVNIFGKKLTYYTPPPAISLH